MSKSYAFTRSVLGAGASEEFEDTLVVLWGNASAIVGHGDLDTVSLFDLDLDHTGPVRRQVFYRIVNEIAENLFERNTVGHDRRSSCRQFETGARLVDLVTNTRRRGGKQFFKIDRFKIELTASFSRHFQDGVDQRVHLGG